MAEQHWQQLEAELDAWHSAGLRCRLWWRDDDLIAATPELYRMHALAEQFAIDVLVAVIPAQMSNTLGRDTSGLHRFQFCQHGYAHQNHALPSQASSEYPTTRQLAEVQRELSDGRMKLEQQLGGRLLSLLVPPWNRFPELWLDELKVLGYAGISQYGDSESHDSQLLRVNATLDVVDWSTAPRFLPEKEESLVKQLLTELRVRRQNPDVQAPIGLLTHHRAMNAAAWSFVERLLITTSEVPCADWVSPRVLFKKERATATM